MSRTVTIAASALALVSLSALQPSIAAESRSTAGGSAARAEVTGSVTVGVRHDATRTQAGEAARVYASGCFWTSKPPIWDEHRGTWVQPRARLCDGE